MDISVVVNSLMSCLCGRGFGTRKTHQSNMMILYSGENLARHPSRRRNIDDSS